MKATFPLPSPAAICGMSYAVTKKVLLSLVLAYLLTGGWAAKALGQDQTAPAQDAASTLPPLEERMILAPIASPPVATAAQPTTAGQTLDLGLPMGKEEDRLRVTTLTPGGYLHYDEEKGSIYSPERTRIVFKGVAMIADVVDFNTKTNDMTAIGNVVLERKDSEIHAEKIRYNFESDEGVAYKARGRYGNAYFQYNKSEKEGRPTVQRLSKEEAVLRGSSATACDFPIPHYRIKAREIIIFPDDHMLFRGAVFYFREFPMMYLPFYSRSLKEGSPWYVTLGYKSRVGAFARLGYAYEHETSVPSVTEPGKWDKKTKGDLHVFADAFSKQGAGFGATYQYMFDSGRHEGESELYYMPSSNRKVETSEVPFHDVTVGVGNTTTGTKSTNGNGDDSGERSQVVLKHRSKITDDVNMIVNVDWLSDPELYDDVLDLFHDQERERVMERRGRTALTYTRDQYVARLLIEVKDRIGRDRVNNYSNPDDNNGDFDTEPGTDVDNRDSEGISTDRWGRVTERLPQITVETIWMRLWSSAVYYHSDLNIFNNLDKGLNTVDEGDDALTQGFDWYNALMGRWRMSERYTAQTKVGVGAGMAIRDDDDFGYWDSDIYEFPLRPANVNGGMVFTDPDTFLIGTEKFNLNQVNPGFVYGDFLERLHARFSDALTGDLTYRYRATTDDSLGDWYASMGDRFVRDDLYNFRLRENNLEGILRYTLAYPRMSLHARSFRNLVSQGDLFPDEIVSDNGVGGQWINQAKTFSLYSGIGLDERQIYHPSDPKAYTNSSMYYNLGAQYMPLSKMWWTKWALNYRQGLKHSSNSDDTSFNERDDRNTLDGLIGGRVGPKWVSEISARWDTRSQGSDSNSNSGGGGLDRLKLTFKRDLHDALLLMAVGVQNDIYKSNDSGDSKGNQMDFRLALQPKLPHGKAPEGVPGIRTLEDQTKTPELEMAEEEMKTYQRY